MGEKRKLPTILIATGASGGHLFPALATAQSLREKGVNCVFVVGGNKFASHIEDAGFAIERLPASAFNVRNPVRKCIAIFHLIRAWFKAFGLMQKYHPSAVLGTGGYATVATVLAAKTVGVPVVLHEQNVLPGRANRFLARFADVIAITFESSRERFAKKAKNMELTGNPVRAQVIEALQEKRVEDGVFRIVILGGSQGARIVSEVVPETIGRLSAEQQKRIAVVHQARPEDLEHVKATYAALPLVDVRVEPFLTDMGHILAQSHLVVTRAGTGAVVETALAGRAAIYVPHPLADGHQMLNAQVGEEAGAAIILSQAVFTVETLLPHITSLLENEERRHMMEQNATELARPNAANDVAELVLDVAKKDVMTMEST